MSLEESGGFFWEYGVSDPLIWAIHSLYDQCQNLVRIASSELDSSEGWTLPVLPFVTDSVHNLAVVLRGSRLVTSGSGLYPLQMNWSCWLHQSVTSNSRWTGLQSSVKRPG